MAFFAMAPRPGRPCSKPFVWPLVQCPPVVFFCQNNQGHLDPGPRPVQDSALYHRAPRFGFPGVHVTGTTARGLRVTNAPSIAPSRRDRR